MADDTTDAGAEAELAGALDGLSARTRGLESGANSFARAMAQAFRAAAIDGRNLDAVLKSLALRLSDLSVTLALRPLTKGLAGGIEGLFAGLFGGTSAPLSGQDKQLMAEVYGMPAFADGGVIAAPGFLPIGDGRMGLAGEAGPEAILPLARAADGRLGVAAGGAAPGATVNITITTPDAASFRRSEAQLTGLVARAVARGQRSL